MSGSYQFGLLGERIATSLSPRLFSWALHTTGLHGTYSLYDFPRKLARSFIVNSRLEWDGLNVTSPYKDLAYELCDVLSETAQVTRSVNTLHRNGSVLCGDNTDVSGFSFALRQCIPAVKHPIERALVIGTGGAARAVILAIAEVLPSVNVSIASRRPASAHDRVGGVMPKLSYSQIVTAKNCVKILDEFDLIVQATPIGSASLPGYPLEPPLNFKRGALVIDLIYAPRKTLFLQAAEAFDATTNNGLTMLLGQAAGAFERWTATPFPLERAIRELLPELQNK